MEPLRLYIKDFYAIADGELDFTKFSSALVLGYYENNQLMSNGAGKSSIFEAICWAIFNETRQTKVDDVIRWNANETIVEFEFGFGRNIHKITRRRSRVAKESSVSFFTKEGDKWINDSGSTNSETNKKILALLKIDSKVFLNSVYFKQHDISLFANSTPSDRKEIIKSIMKLERWDEYQKQSKNKLKVVRDDIEKQIRILQENANVNIFHIANEKAIEQVKSDIEALKEQGKNAQLKLHSLIELRKERDINNLTKLRDDVANKIAELKVNGKLLQSRQASINSVLDENIIKINNILQKIADTENIINILYQSIQELSEQNTAYEELEEDIFAKKLEKGQLQQTLNSLSETASKVGVGQCNVCFTTITKASLPHIHESRKQTQHDAEHSLTEINKKIQKIEAEYRRRKDTKDKLEYTVAELDGYKHNLEKLQAQKQIADEDNVAYENENAVILTSLRTTIEQVKAHKIDIEALESKIAEQRISNVDDEIASMEQSAREINNGLTSRNIELGTLLREAEIISQKGDAVNAAQAAMAKLGKEKTACEQLSRFFGKEGIQAVFIESIVDELEQYANETLSYICNEPTVIRLKTQKKTGDSWQETLEIDVIMNGFQQTFESLGGGEMFRISLALRIGLSEVLVKKAGGEIKLLLLDEVDSPLDAHGLNNLFDSIIKGLEKRFKILVISHNDKLKDRFSDLVIVNKTNNGSFISQS